MLSFNEITLKRDQRTLISNFSAHFFAGDLIHVQGVNGVGKTTFLRALASLNIPASGSIFFKGDDINDLAHLYHRQFLYLGHNLGLKEDLNGLDNLRALLSIRAYDGIEALDSKILSALATLGLKNISRAIRQLSAGQRRRVALARLFLENCPIWILDEPFTALDTQTITLLENKICLHCSQGGIVVMSSHQPLSGHIKTIPLVLSRTRAHQLGAQ